MAEPARPCAGRTTTRRVGARRRRPRARARRPRRHVDGRDGRATCATGSWSRCVFTDPDRRCGRRSARRCSATGSRRRSACGTTSGCCCSACRWSSTRRGSSSTAPCAALRARTLDMMVLVAVAVGAGWLYRVAVTFFTGGGEVFYEAAARAGRVRAARALVRDARPRRRQRRHPRAAGPRAAEGGRAARRRAGRGADRRGRRSATCCWSAPARRSRSTASSRTARAEVDESMVTGESLPVHKTRRRRRSSARRSTRPARCGSAPPRSASDTALAQIVELVQEAQNSKAPGQRLADRAAFWLVLVALIGGGADLRRLVFVVGRDVQDALLFAITVVVITCPDALGLATPTAIMVGTGLGAKRGMLFKNAMALETGRRASTPSCMDKTGTLTRANPRSPTSDRRRRRRGRAAAPGRRGRAASPSTRWPQAIVSAAPTRGARRRRAPTAFENVPGHGAARRRSTATGWPSATRRLLDARGRRPRRAGRARATSWPASGRTAVQVAVDGRAAGGHRASPTRPRETAAAAVAALHDARRRGRSC